jgi:hypothetical protein
LLTKLDARLRGNDRKTHRPLNSLVTNSFKQESIIICLPVADGLTAVAKIITLAMFFIHLKKSLGTNYGEFNAVLRRIEKRERFDQ